MIWDEGVRRRSGDRRESPGRDLLEEKVPRSYGDMLQ